MTQRHIPHNPPLPACRAGHVARHIHDARRLSAGGGHLIECQCRHTERHAEFDDALAQWCRENGRTRPRPARQQQLPIDNVVRFNAR